MCLGQEGVESGSVSLRNLKDKNEALMTMVGSQKGHEEIKEEGETTGNLLATIDIPVTFCLTSNCNWVRMSLECDHKTAPPSFCFPHLIFLQSY